MMMDIFTGKAIPLILMLILVSFSSIVNSNSIGIREKRGAAYAGGHPGGGYGSEGVGIPGINSVIQYSAYNSLLNSGNHGQSSGYGGGSSHGRKLTVDQAIGMYGGHTLNRPSAYTASHGSSGHSGGGGGGGYGGGGRSPSPSYRR